MEYTQAEILQTVRMTEMEHLDIRTVTLGLSLRDCASDSLEKTAERVREKIERTAGRLVSVVDEIGDGGLFAEDHEDWFAVDAGLLEIVA